ncbi:hypothetical protein H5410_040216 [Solanum commersonii]|uniref:Protein kinase domain-containing protein n=1 Tax=Solanum commersonii TaxID=4109 RepID=A0A9J5XRU6_SOLCO|nr:hypothetical protein H5410_040216 [Solanum commersonii]
MDGSAPQTDTVMSDAAAGQQPATPPLPMAGMENIPATLSHGGRFIQYNIFGNIFEVTAKYKPPIMPIGKGAYGIVCSALNSETNEHVAIKKIANAFDNKIDAKRTLREIKLLRHMDHENIVAIRDIIPPPQREVFNDVYIAYELMDTDLHQIIRSNQGLSEEHCQVSLHSTNFTGYLSPPTNNIYQYFLYQILRGLKYIHSANVLHRDLKPSNLLLNANCDLKICDFGLARVTSETDFMTEYVVTRWYRPPELLLNSSDYTAAIDVWSVGCIFMELMDRKPLFPGRDHVHQLRLLMELIGTPSEAEMEFLNENAKRYIRQLPLYRRQSFVEKFPHVNPAAIDLVEKMLTFDPRRRLTEDPFDVETQAIISQENNALFLNTQADTINAADIQKQIIERCVLDPSKSSAFLEDPTRVQQHFWRVRATQMSDMSWVMPRNSLDLLSSWRAGSPDQQRTWSIVPGCTWWTIWSVELEML